MSLHSKKIHLLKLITDFSANWSVTTIKSGDDQLHWEIQCALYDASTGWNPEPSEAFEYFASNLLGARTSSKLLYALLFFCFYRLCLSKRDRPTAPTIKRSLSTSRRSAISNHASLRCVWKHSTGGIGLRRSRGVMCLLATLIAGGCSYDVETCLLETTFHRWLNSHQMVTAFICYWPPFAAATEGETAPCPPGASPEPNTSRSAQWIIRYLQHLSDLQCIVFKQHFELASSYLGSSLRKECQILHYSVMQRLRAFWTMTVEHIATFLYTEGMYLGPCPSNRTSWAEETWYFTVRGSEPLLRDRQDSDQTKSSLSSDGLKGNSTTKIKYQT